MKVCEVMTRRVVAATPKASCQEIAKKMLSGYFSGMPVVDEEQRIVGIVSEFDLIKAMQGQGEAGICNATTEEVMSKNPIYIEEDATIEAAIDMMMQHHFVRLPVVSEGKLVGILSRSDILRAFVSDSFVTILEGDITNHE